MGVSSLTVKEDVSILRRRIFYHYFYHHLTRYYFDIYELQAKKEIFYERAVVGRKERGPLFKRKSSQWYFLSKVVETQVVNM